MARRKWSWTQLQKERAKNVLAATENLRGHWPLTLRQIYYQLVKDSHVLNNRSQYIMLSKLVKWMRIDSMLAWNALEDRTRTLTRKRGWEDVDEFIYDEVDGFLTGYTRCLVQGQDNYIEVWTEKDALVRIFARAVWPYCIRAVVCRGYNSVTFIADFYKRAERALEQGQQPIVLYWGDLDPSGIQMLEATIETLENELGLTGVEFKRIGLNPEHIALYNLPSDPTAAKMSDPRYRSYVERYGRVAVELDAVHPDQLTPMITDAIEAELDMEQFHLQQGIEQQDDRHLKDVRATVMEAIEDSRPELFY